MSERLRSAAKACLFHASRLRKAAEFYEKKRDELAKLRSESDLSGPATKEDVVSIYEKIAGVNQRLTAFQASQADAFASVLNFMDAVEKQAGNQLNLSLDIAEKVNDALGEPRDDGDWWKDGPPGDDEG